MQSTLLFVSAAFVLMAASPPPPPPNEDRMDPVLVDKSSSRFEGSGRFVEFSRNRFDLFGSDSGAEDSFTNYAAVAAADRRFSILFRYQTDDPGGSNFDPAGYFINATRFQLSAPDLPWNGENSGAFIFSVAAGDSYGFYVANRGNSPGAGSLQVTSVPEPANWAMLIAGFGLVGAVARRRRNTVTA
jgi:hypothetical protein